MLSFSSALTVRTLAPFLLAGSLAACSDPEPEAASVTVETVEPGDVESDVTEASATEIPAKTGTTTETAETETRSADSHIHGDANLAIVLEGSRLSVEFESPVYNLLGYEHLPNTDAQRDTLEKAEATLSDPSAILVTNAEAGCAPLPVEWDVHIFDDTDHAHSHGNDDHDGDHAEHRDVLVTYSYDCASPSDLRSASVELLKAFPLMDDLDVVYLGPDTQTSFELNQSETDIAFGR